MGNIFGHSNKSGPKTRTVVPNFLHSDEDNPNHHYHNNRIKTTKYTLLTFLPKNLFEQFHRFANLYFIFVVCLNWVPQVQAFGKEIAMLPVVFVLTVTAVKDAFEDFRRYKSDQKINHNNCRKYKRKKQDSSVHNENEIEHRYVKAEWQDLQVGDFVHLSCNEIIPADMVLVKSSDPMGICHIETCNLDGETNLKQRQEIAGIRKHKDREFTVHDFTHTIECDLPNSEIYKFHGSISWKEGNKEEKASLNKNNLLLRGCTIRNTDFVEGIVVYAGHDTKAMLNNRSPRYKRSKLERNINRDVVFCVMLLLFLCFFCAIASAVWLGSYSDRETVPFIPFEGNEWYNPYFQGFVVFFTYIIIYQTVIPLPLYVSVELVKMGQIYFINNDLNLYYEEMDKRIDCRALNITEDLGQVEYIFSDKTGTLTENQMEFKACSIYGRDYPHDPDDAMSDTGSKFSLASTSRSSMMIENLNLEPELQRELSKMCLRSLNSVDISLESTSRMERSSKIVQEFFLLMAVCNTVVVSTRSHEDNMDESGSIHDIISDPPERYTRLNEHGKKIPTDNGFSKKMLPETPAGKKTVLPPIEDRKERKLPNTLPPIMANSQDFMNSRLDTSSPALTPSEGSIASTFISDLSNKNQYEAESPDELALVKAACTYGCCLLKRSPDKAVVWLPAQGEVDFEILDILQFDSVRKRMSVILRNPENEEIVMYTKGADSAILSVLHRKYKDDPELKEVVEKTTQHIIDYSMKGLRTLCMAKKNLTLEFYRNWRVRFKEAEAAFENRDERIIEVSCEIEQDLELLGATGIEDKLQDEVPETIYKLRQAGIKIWVLTGDKQETAIQVAYSSRLFSEKQQLMIINADNKDETEAMLKEHIEMIKRDRTSTRRRHDSSDAQGNKKEYALVIDGKTLAFALDKSIQHLFLNLAVGCKSVVCCRSTPIQKGSVVKLIRDRFKKLTLAVGDGANDVSMLHVADIGIGLAGQEGMQAVMASDFAICRFRHLQRLLLVHGHWCYARLSSFSRFMFYKSLILIFSMYWYQFFSGYSGSLQYDSLYMMLKHVLFTALPPIVSGVLDKDLSEKTLLEKPEIYKSGPKDTLYTKTTFFFTLLDSLWQSAILYFVCHLAYEKESVGIWEYGSTMFTALILIVLLTCAIDTETWIWPQWVSTVSSFFVYWLSAIVLNSIWFTFDHPANPYWVMQNTLVKPIHFIVIFLSTLVALFPRFVIKVLKRTIRPSDIVKAQLEEKMQEDIKPDKGKPRSETHQSLDTNITNVPHDSEAEAQEIEQTTSIAANGEYQVKYRNGKHRANKSVGESAT